MSQKIKPYNTQKSKKNEVEEMFDNISSKYDFLNRLLSARIDVLWRNQVVSKAKKENPEKILDVATGTGDLAIALARKIKASKITGYDLSAGMLQIGKQKISKKNLQNRIEMIQGDAENMPFDDDFFDAITVAFGVRNFENLDQGLTEFYRVLKPGGKLFILEFSQPQKFPMKQLYQFYSYRILPAIGQLFSKDSRAYTYLPESVSAFPHGEEMLNILKKNQFKQVKDKKLTFGISSIYEAIK
ncbi:Ubiquinone/menaquinone biosynthesis methyltransferase ubiE [Candidatus Ornithobacterium hominis]|uniref:bifunctional demethylmenaquinone methyltransferase/2-methoxy-6-polyprenyl-1,4-benzoquinol methylase UbiE n=1 Tax=Candidatus Ornithobacterium hominis TaxID=2497989 RepID=UPI000E5AE6C3|nr:bifunctional demethylmenaquinone methyltransferase/2-methoxy-6-polyprenyl-1,4-benzoquinol methylase UbiE [Candidatus Ornithobacterium hominis]SZD73187.1 Ubiquinone/menaquinone biosynthesis methyltransferase ubiE [Candidatus Ornithobacterium hominis]